MCERDRKSVSSSTTEQKTLKWNRIKSVNIVRPRERSTHTCSMSCEQLKQNKTETEKRREKEKRALGNYEAIKTISSEERHRQREWQERKKMERNEQNSLFFVILFIFECIFVWQRVEYIHNWRWSSYVVDNTIHMDDRNRYLYSIEVTCIIPNHTTSFVFNSIFMP